MIFFSASNRFVQAAPVIRSILCVLLRTAVLPASWRSRTSSPVLACTVRWSFAHACGHSAPAPPQAVQHSVKPQAREQYRVPGRSLPRRGVGSRLLLKGLEAEVWVILEADKLNAKNLYVALTRGSKKLVVCARSPILAP